jgi:hypothetical protein
MDRRQMDRVRVVNRAYLFRKNFSPTLQARAGLAALLALLCAHRIVNREWAGLAGLLDGMRYVRSSRSPRAQAPVLDRVLRPPLPSLRLAATVPWMLLLLLFGLYLGILDHEFFEPH